MVSQCSEGNVGESMKAAVLSKPGFFEVKDVPLPDVGPNDVLIRVDRCGICGTDIHIFNGEYSVDQLPLIPGHEFMGTVAECGEKVVGLNPSQKVVADTNIGCGNCFFCRKNEVFNCPNMRQVGITRDGGFAEFVVVPDRLVIRAPNNTPSEKLVLTEPLSCVIRSARKSKASFGQSAVILGAGPIGNLHVQFLRAIGLAPIIVLEISPVRARIAKDSGADRVFSDSEELRKSVLELTDQRGADLVIESVGKPDLYSFAFELVRPGGSVVAFGLTGQDASIEVKPINFVLRELTICGSVAGMGQDMHDSLTFLTHDRIDTRHFTQSTAKLDDIQSVFESISKHPEILKTQIEI